MEVDQLQRLQTDPNVLEGQDFQSEIGARPKYATTAAGRARMQSITDHPCNMAQHRLTGRDAITTSC